MKRMLAVGCILLLGFFGWVAQDARAFSLTPTPITPMPDFVPKNYVPQSVTMSTNLLRNFQFGEDNFGLIEIWAQTSIDLQRWYLVQAVPPDQPNARWVDRVDLAPEEQGYALQSTDGQMCDHYCGTEAVQIVAAEENVFYVLSASARVAKGTAGLYLDFLDADRSRIQPYTRGGYTDRWTWQTVAAKAPPGTRYIRVILYTGNLEQATIYWRDVRLHSLSAELSPMPPEGTNVAVDKRVIARAGGVTYTAWGNANDEVDFNTTTRLDGGRWGNQTTQGTFETVDLGSLHTLVGVGHHIDWDWAFHNPLTFRVDVSSDNIHWTTVSTVIHQPAGEGGTTFATIDIPINPIVGRYVRYSELQDGEWNGWGDIVQLRAFARLSDTVTLATPTPFIPQTPIRSPTGTPPENTSWVTAAPLTAPGCALSFDGNDDYVDLGRWFDLNTFTISMWVNPANAQVTYANIIDNNHTDYRSWVLQQDRDWTNWYLWGVASSPAVIVFHLNADTWQHLVITRDAAGTSRVYVNTSLGGMSAGLSAIPYDGTQMLSLGRWGGAGRNWKGQLDEVQIWNVALPPEQIKQPQAGIDEHLIAYYHFDECSDTTAHDNSSHEHDGKLVTYASP